MWKKIFKFFDRLEDRVRSWLSRHPILYTLIGGVAIVLFWRGVWHTADLFPFLTGPVSIAISIIILLVSGLFVSFFIGDRILMSGLKGEKKLTEKTEEEVRSEVVTIEKVHRELHEIEKEIKELKKE